jgi:caffeoyl-CoA O-methyltransferase
VSARKGQLVEKSFGADAGMFDYVVRVFEPEDAILRGIRERAVAAGLPAIQVGALDGLHLEVLARAIGARRVVELGTLGGYSGVSLLRGMAPDGILDTFELEPKNAEVARRSFAEAGFADRVRIHVGPASERLADVEHEGPFDLVFIDADKVGYPAYLAWAEANLRIGGVVLGDNAFGWGGVVAEAPPPEDVAAITALRSFNERLARGGRFRATMLPTGEGLAMGVKVR